MQEEHMYAVVRTYSGAGAKELFNLLEQRKADVEAVMRRVPGLVSYTLVQSAEGGIAVTVCKDKAGAEESTRLAKEWIEEHSSELSSKLPTIDLGSVLVQIT
jgi:hypothetical protein